jgi:maltooligosyltrehalose trehalohydrolase
MKKHFSVWSPFSRNVELVIGSRHFPMQKDADSWWRIDLPVNGTSIDYSFCIDGSKPLPDPRSFFQPEGVHGHSRWIDHSRFNWNDEGFQQVPLSSAIIYELHIGTFTPEGTFNGCISKLDYLKALGITHIELMPVAGFHGSRGWGYDGVTLFAPHRAYGDPASLKRLVNECHMKGLAVILDVVYNHLGPEGNYLDFFGPYFTDTYKTPWGKAINFDGPYSDEVRQFFIDNAIMWLKDYHMDGLRIDAIHSIYDMSALHFLEEMSVKIEGLETELEKQCVLIAESDLNDPRFIRSRDAYGCGLDAQWNDDFHHALHTVLSGEKNGYYNDFGTLDHFVKAYTSAYVYDGQYSRYRYRKHGRAITHLAGDKFVVCNQNHDQVGNRAQGERFSFLINNEKVKIASALLMMSPFVPMLFQGEEWGASTPFLYFTDHQDEELGKAVLEGRRKEFSSFGWKAEDIPDPQNEKTFLSSKLKWEEIKKEPHNKLLDWYKSLITLRKTYPGLSCDRLDRASIDYDTDEIWMTIQRNDISIFCNMSDKTRTINKPEKNLNILLSSSTAIHIKDKKIVMPRFSIAIASAIR